MADRQQETSKFMQNFASKETSTTKTRDESSPEESFPKQHQKTRFYSIYSHEDDSLQLISGDVSVEHETDVRRCIYQKISKVSPCRIGGCIVTLPFSLTEDAESTAICYFYYLKLTQPGIVGDGTTGQYFVICFIGEKEENLDLFQKDFNDFCSGLHNQFNGTSFNTDYIEKWYDKSVEYLSLVVTTFQHSLKHLLYLSMMGHKFTLIGASENITHSINKFVDCCSLSQLLQPDSQTTTSSCVSESNSLVDLGNEVQDVGQDLLVVTVTDNEIIVDDKYVTQFCEEWCTALIDKVSMGPVCLMQIINSYKLKCIHDVNELNRLIKLAENDLYALYRTYSFLKSCHNARVLLLYAKQENHITQSTESQDVLRVLSDYIRETGGTVEQ